jgi:hypothetical protein
MSHTGFRTPERFILEPLKARQNVAKSGDFTARPLTHFYNPFFPGGPMYTQKEHAAFWQ